MFQNNEIINVTNTKSNADIIADTYYDYHGKHEDAYTSIETIALKGVVLA